MSDSSRFPEHGEQSQAGAVPKQRTEASVEERAEQRPVMAKPAVAAATAAGADSAGRIFHADAAEKLRDRWHSIQTDFVDDPRLAVEQAETLVGQVSEQLTEAIAEHRTRLRARWQPDGPGSAADDGGTATEELRIVLQEYRRVLNRMLEI